MRSLCGPRRTATRREPSRETRNRRQRGSCPKESTAPTRSYVGAIPAKICGARALAMLRNKRATRPPKKHGNIPL